MHQNEIKNKDGLGSFGEMILYEIYYYFQTEKSEVIFAMFCGYRCLQRRAKRLASNVLFPSFKLGNNTYRRRGSSQCRLCLMRYVWCIIRIIAKNREKSTIFKVNEGRYLGYFALFVLSTWNLTLNYEKSQKKRIFFYISFFRNKVPLAKKPRTPKGHPGQN